MSTEKRFDVAPPNGDKDDALPPPGGGPDPSAAPKPKSGLHRPSAERRTGTPGRPVRRKPVKQRAGRPEPEAPGLPLLFRPGFLLVVGAGVLAILWGGGLFGGAGGTVWPWEQFQTAGGAVTFAWDEAHVSALLGALFILFFLFAPFGPQVRSRGGAVLAVAALGLVTLPPTGLLGRVALLAGLAAAAVLGREGLRGRAGGRAFLFVLVLLLAASLFYPVGAAWTSLGTNLIDRVVAGEDLGTLLLEPQTALLLMAFLLLVVGVISWLGFGGRWAVWVGGIALYLAVLGPLGLAFYAHADATKTLTCAGALQAVVATLAALELHTLAFVLPAAAGAIDLSRP